MRSSGRPMTRDFAIAVAALFPAQTERAPANKGACRHFKLMLKGSHQDRSCSIEYVPFLNAVVEMRHDDSRTPWRRAGSSRPRGGGPAGGEGRKKAQRGCDGCFVDALIVSESNCEEHGNMVECDAFLETMF